MGIFDKIKNAFKKSKQEKTAESKAYSESTEEFAVEMNRETLEIYAAINEVDAEKRAEFAERAKACIEKYLDRVDDIQKEIDKAQAAYESYRDDDEIIAHLSDAEFENELNAFMTDVLKKEISAKESKASFEALVMLKDVLEGEQNFVNDKQIEPVLNGNKSVSQIEATASVEAKKKHAKYFEKDGSIFSPEFLSFVGKVASAITIAQGAAEVNPAKAVAGAALYTANSNLQKKKSPEQTASQKGE